MPEVAALVILECDFHHDVVPVNGTCEAFERGTLYRIAVALDVDLGELLRPPVWKEVTGP